MSRNGGIVLACSVVIAIMLTLVAFSPPLYRVFCAATGLGGTTRRASAVDASSDPMNRTVEVRFNTSVDADLPWGFGPMQRSLTVRLGHPTLARFWAENDSNETIVAHATYNVTPDLAGQYFNKIQCFCFTEERLAPHQRVEMPVLFFVAPAILKDRDIGNLPAITLSYSFFRSPQPKGASDLARFGAQTVSAQNIGPANPAHGAQVFSAQCSPCHALDHNKIGPMLGGLSGRHAGAVSDFAYSDALRHASIVWHPDTLNKWLADPRADVPGVHMPVEVADPQTRADVIAYLLTPKAPQ